MLSSMSSRKFATLEPEERQQVIDGIYKKLEPQITKALQQYLASVTPEMQKIVRAEMGKWAVTEKQARAFIDGMVVDASEKVAAYMRPRWLFRVIFRRNTHG